jgi:hypothetical protein
MLVLSNKYIKLIIIMEFTIFNQRKTPGFLKSYKNDETFKKYEGKIVRCYIYLIIH